MKNKYAYFKVIFLLTFISCKNICSQNIYWNPPPRPLLGDSITAPEFIGGYKSFKDTISKELDKIYIREHMEGYSRLYFTIEIDEYGVASKQKIIDVSDKIEKQFNEVNYSLLNKIKNWKPAINKKGNLPVKYTLRIEIESFEKRIKLSLFNNDMQMMFKEDL